MVYILRSNIINNLRYAERSNKNKHDQNMHNSLKFFILFSQILGMLPQQNICKSHKEMYFKWKSWRVFYTLIMIILTSTAVFLCFLMWFYVESRFLSIGYHVFYVGSAISFILFLRLATSWSKLMTSWCRMDKIMNCSYGYPKNLDRRFKIVFTIFLLLASITTNFRNYEWLIRKVSKCISIFDFGWDENQATEYRTLCWSKYPMLNSRTHKMILTSEFFLGVISKYMYLKTRYQEQYEFGYFYRLSSPQLAFFIPMNIYSAVYCSMITFQASFSWAYNDLFIILLSMGLADRFRQITKKLEKQYKKDQQEQFWIDIRKDYDRLTILCKELDDHISYIVLLSYTINVFFLLIQLHNTLQSNTIFATIYFAYFSIYIVVKIVSVSLYASWVNDASLEPVEFLNSVSSTSYNIEIKRLMVRINLDNVVLTGCNLFKVKRGIVLSIAGAVVTYELMLIQFNMNTNMQP